MGYAYTNLQFCNPENGGTPDVETIFIQGATQNRGCQGSGGCGRVCGGNFGAATHRLLCGWTLFPGAGLPREMEGLQRLRLGVTAAHLFAFLIVK